MKINPVRGSVTIIIVAIVSAIVALGAVWFIFFQSNNNVGQFLPPGVNLARMCCTECYNLANPTDTPIVNQQEKSCLESTSLNKDCKDFFQKNSTWEKECANSQLGLLALPTSTPETGEDGNIDGGGILGGLLGQPKCDHQYVWWRDLEEIEKRFKGKTWSGTFSSDHHCTDGSGYSYDVKITGLEIVFDQEFETFMKSAQNFKKVGIWNPCTFESYYGFMGLKMKGKANITYGTFTNSMKAAHYSGICHFTCAVTNNPIPFNVRGRIFFTDEGIKLGLNAEKIGVNIDEILERCGQEDSNCDENALVNDIQIDMKGSCNGSYCNGDPFHCVMNNNDDCGNNWQVNEIIGEGDIELVNDKDIKLNAHTGSCSVGDSDKDFSLTGTLQLK